MFPKPKQWKKWTLPSKYSDIGVILAIIGILFSFFQYWSSNDEEAILTNIKSEVEKAIETSKGRDIQKQNYINRYIKNPLAEIIEVKISRYENKPVAYVYYNSEWFKLTSNYMAAVEVRKNC